MESKNIFYFSHQWLQVILRKILAACFLATTLSQIYRYSVYHSGVKLSKQAKNVKFSHILYMTEQLNRQIHTG